MSSNKIHTFKTIHFERCCTCIGICSTYYIDLAKIGITLKSFIILILLLPNIKLNL